MRPIATDVTRGVICLSVCWSHGCVLQKKRLKRLSCRLGGWLMLIQRNHALDGVKIGRIHSQLWWCGYLPNYFGRLLQRALLILVRCDVIEKRILLLRSFFSLWILFRQLYLGSYARQCKNKLWSLWRDKLFNWQNNIDISQILTKGKIIISNSAQFYNVSK